MARTNLHDIANRLLEGLQQAAIDHTFEGKLRQVAQDAGLNAVRSAEAIKLLEDLGRIDVAQRGRRGRNTVVHIRSNDPVTLEEARSAGPRATATKTRLTHDEIGRAVVDRLLELARDDGLRAAQVDAFARENEQHRDRAQSLEAELESALLRETDLRLKLKAAEEALERAEENLRRALHTRAPVSPQPVADDEARAVLDILRSGRE